MQAIIAEGDKIGRCDASVRSSIEELVLLASHFNFSEFQSAVGDKSLPKFDNADYLKAIINPIANGVNL